MTVKQDSIGLVYVIANDRSVSSATIVDNKKWGDGYLVLQDSSGREFVSETYRCFKNAISAADAAASKRICQEFGIKATLNLGNDLRDPTSDPSVDAFFDMEAFPLRR